MAGLLLASGLTAKANIATNVQSISRRNAAPVSVQPCTSRRVTCTAHADHKDDDVTRSAVAGSSRRQLLLAGGAAVSASVILPGTAFAEETSSGFEKRVLSATSLTTFQRRAQRQALKDRAARELAKVLTPGDANLTMRLLFNDAGTYDVTTNTGGVDGSVVLPEELNRPENKILKPLVEKLTKAKEAIDAQSAAVGQQAISWADLIVLAAREAVYADWFRIKVERAPIASGGEVIAKAFGIPFDVSLGRMDSNTPAPAGRIPQDDASIDEIHDYLYALGNKNPEGGFGKGKPPLWERPAFVLWTAAQPDPAAAEERLSTDKRFAGYKKKYDDSRRTVTRTEYEVDFNEYFNRLANMGAKFNKDAYLYDTTVLVPRLR